MNKEITREQMLETIYEKIADKTLSKPYDYEVKCECGFIIPIYKPIKYSKPYTNICKDVMIGDVVDYIEATKLSEFKSNDAFDILNNWEEKRKPIEDQTIECIKYIYNFINL